MTANDREFTSAADDAPEQLYALWDGAVDRSRARHGAALADGWMGQLAHASVPPAAMPACGGCAVFPADALYTPILRKAGHVVR